MVVTGLLPFAVAPIGWWLVGDLTSPEVRGRSDLMYLISPPRWTVGRDRLVFIVSSLAAIFLSLAVAHMRKSEGRGWIGILAGAWGLGLAWGGLGRVLTVGAAGATMSGLALPLIPVLVVLGGWLALRAGSEPR